MDANTAPKAFGADAVIKPGMWIIHYKGQVSPPTPGTYRFWGFSDDLIAVAVNGKTELVSFFTIWKAPPQVYVKTDPPGEKAADGTLVAGDWFTVAANDVIDLDVLIGERPGGTFNAFLMVQKKDQTYQDGSPAVMAVNGASAGEASATSPNAPILPIFQVAPYNTPVINDVNQEPKFATGFPPWKCYQ
jgi:hypothetical protein